MLLWVQIDFLKLVPIMRVCLICNKFHRHRSKSCRQTTRIRRKEISKVHVMHSLLSDSCFHTVYVSGWVLPLLWAGWSICPWGIWVIIGWTFSAPSMLNIQLVETFHFSFFLNGQKIGLCRHIGYTGNIYSRIPWWTAWRLNWWF